MTFEFVPDHAGIKRLANSDGIRDLVNDKVRKVEAAAQSSAPHFADYDTSIGSTPAEKTADGWEGTVYSSSSFWHLVEFGSVNNSPYRTLSQAVSAAGLKVEDG